MDLEDFYVVAVLLLGGGMSGLAFFLRRQQKPERTRMEVSAGIFASSRRVGEAMVFIAGTNVGNRMITLSSFGLRLPTGKALVIPTTRAGSRLPLELYAGKNCTFFIPVRQVAQACREEGHSGIVKLVPLVSTPTGRVLTGARITFDASSTVAD